MTEPRPRHVGLAELAELCGDDAEALYWLSQQYPSTINDAQATLKHWSALREYFETLRMRHELGDGTAAFTALSVADNSATALPGWASQALTRGWTAYSLADPAVRNLEDAWNLKVKRNPATRRKVLFGFFAWRLVHYGHSAGRHIDRGLYEWVAEQLRDPSKIPQPIARRAVESARAQLEAEGRDPDKSLTGSTVERWYEAHEKSHRKSVAEAATGKRETSKPAKKYHFIFGR